MVALHTLACRGGGRGATIEAGITLRPHLKMTKVIGNRICKDCLTEDNASYNNGRGAIVNFVRGLLMQQNQVREQILSLGAKSTKLKKSISQVPLLWLNSSNLMQLKIQAVLSTCGR